jgi:hypothetical protein
VLLNPLYFILSNAVVGWLHMSDWAWVHFMQVGWLVGLIALVFGILAKAPDGEAWLRWALIVVAFGEWLFWSLIGVGM